MSTAADLFEQRVKMYKGMGLSEASARLAARDRGASGAAEEIARAIGRRRAGVSTTEGQAANVERLKALGLSEAEAQTAAKGLLQEAKDDESMRQAVGQRRAQERYL